MYLWQSEARRRHQYAEDSIETAAELIAQPDVRAMLGKVAAYELANHIGMFAVPNIRHGKVTIPESHQAADRIPVIPVAAGETLHIPASHYYRATHRQLMDAALRLVARGVEPSLDAHDPYHLREHMAGVAADRPDMAIRLPRMAAAFVPHRKMRIYDRLHEPVVDVDVRPITVVAYDQKRTRISPDVVVHEAVHVKQRLQGEPTLSGQAGEDIVAREEIEAFYLQAGFQDGMRAVGYVPDRKGDHYDPLRSGNMQARPIAALTREMNHDRADLFEPNQKLLRAIAQCGLLLTAEDALSDDTNL